MLSSPACSVVYPNKLPDLLNDQLILCIYTMNLIKMIFAMNIIKTLKMSYSQLGAVNNMSD